jgi:hypothetical protein
MSTSFFGRAGWVGRLVEPWIEGEHEISQALTTCFLEGGKIRDNCAVCAELSS